MRKQRLLSFLMLVVFLATSAGINAQEKAILPYNPDAPAGTATPFEGWGDVQYALEVDALGTAPEASDLSAYFQGAWDATNLYFYFNVVDDTLIDVNPDASWNGDAVELAISLDDASFNLFWGGDSNDDGKLTFTYTDDAAAVESRLLEMSGFAANGGTIDTRTSETGYEIALKVPLASIGDVITDMTTVTSFRVEVAVNDRDDNADARQNMITWSGITNPNVDVSGFGTFYTGKFADDPVSGNALNYTTLIPENWEISEFGDGNLGFGMNTSAVNPIHASGDPWADPDGPDGPLGNGSGSGLGDYATLADSYSDMKVTAEIAKPNFDIGNDYWDCGIVWGMLDDTKYNYVNFGAAEANTCAAAVVDNEGLRNYVSGIVANHNLVMFDDTLFHEVELMKVGDIVILKYEGIPVVSMNATEVGGSGMVGFGSWNDGVIIDNVVVEAINEFGASTDVSFTSSIGTLENDTLIGIPEETTVQELLDDLTLAAGATAIVVEKNAIEGDDHNGYVLEVDGSSLITNTLSIQITSEAGFMLRVALMTSNLSSDASIAAYFSPLELDSATMTISTIEGITLATFLGKIRPLETSTEAVLDADKNEITDEAAIIMDGMFYRVTAEDGTIVDYPITCYEPPYPTLSALRVDPDNEVIIDAWFTEWAAYENGFAIDLVEESETLVAPSSDADLSATVKLAWDDEFLYVYFYVLDDITNVNADLNSWDIDGIEIATVMCDDVDGRSGYNMFWNAAGQPGNMKLLYNPGTTLGQMVSGGLNTGSDVRDFTGAILEMWALEDGDTGYELEYQIPWTTLNGNVNEDPFIVAEGNQFSFNAAMNDNDGGDSRESITMIMSGNMNMDAIEYPLVKLEAFGGSTAVKEAVAKMISIYPNPVADFMTISGVENATSLEITNVTGQLVTRSQYDSVGEMNLNVSSLTSGVYFIRALDQDGTIAVGKFYKK